MLWCYFITHEHFIKRYKQWRKEREKAEEMISIGQQEGISREKIELRGYLQAMYRIKLLNDLNKLLIY